MIISNVIMGANTHFGIPKCHKTYCHFALLSFELLAMLITPGNMINFQDEGDSNVSSKDCLLFD